jgi:alpha-tubulin suppressor-like RCC1 family protein
MPLVFVQTYKNPVTILDGRVFAWGDNNEGALGLNNVSLTLSPVQMGSNDWTTIRTFSGVQNENRAFTGSVRIDGTLWMWGSNASGQLGLGVQDGGLPGLLRSSPTQVGSLTDWTFVSVGGQHTVALKNDGRLFAWGGNGSGQLGQGNNISRSSPVQIAGTWSLASAGHNCSFGIRDNGTLWAWGVNSNGKLGLNDTTTRLTPVQVGVLTDWVGVLSSGGVGSGHTMALRQGGQFYTWGRNNLGQLGFSDIVDRSMPAQVGGLWKAFACGQEHTAAIASNGSLWTWGNGTDGRLGNGSTTNQSSPVQIGLETDWIYVAGGGFNTLGIRGAGGKGRLWGWGANGQGQLGQGNTTPQSSPVAVGSETDWIDASIGTASFGTPAFGIRDI